MSKQSTVRVKLNHHCRKAGCAGNIGDEIEVSAEDAKYLLARGGATVLAQPKATAEPQPKATDKPVAPPEPEAKR